MSTRVIEEGHLLLSCDGMFEFFESRDKAIARAKALCNVSELGGELPRSNPICMVKAEIFRPRQP